MRFLQNSPPGILLIKRNWSKFLGQPINMVLNEETIDDVQLAINQPIFHGQLLLTITNSARLGSNLSLPLPRLEVYFHRPQANELPPTRRAADSSSNYRSYVRKARRCNWLRYSEVGSTAAANTRIRSIPCLVSLPIFAFPRGIRSSSVRSSSTRRFKYIKTACDFSHFSLTRHRRLTDVYILFVEI